MEEVIFMVEESDEGGFIAKGLGVLPLLEFCKNASRRCCVLSASIVAGHSSASSLHQQHEL